MPARSATPLIRPADELFLLQVIPTIRNLDFLEQWCAESGRSGAQTVWHLIHKVCFRAAGAPSSSPTT